MSCIHEIKSFIKNSFLPSYSHRIALTALEWLELVG